MTMKSTAALLLLLLQSTSAAPDEQQHRALAASPLWDEGESFDTYVHYPEDMKAVLEEEVKADDRGSPGVEVFTTIPEPSQQIWPLVKEMIIRNHLQNKIMWAKPNYVITSGLNVGCRTGDADNSVPVEGSALCDDHCVHKGRYCAPFQPGQLPAELPEGFKGKDLVKESMRRLCFDHYYHASDYKFFDYLERFDRAQCLQQPDVTACALQVLEGIPHADYANLAACMDDSGMDQDTTNKILEQQLKDAEKFGVVNFQQDVPELHLGGELYTGEYSTNAIFDHYCKNFPEEKITPVSCDICVKCHNVRKCLWSLECDGTPFDSTAWLMEHHPEEQAVETPPPVTATNPPVTAAPVTVAPFATLSPGGGSASSVSTTDNSNVGTIYDESGQDEEEPKSKVIMVFFILALTISGLVAGFLAYRDRRTRFLMSEIESSRIEAESYRDGDSYVDYVDDSLRSMDDVDVDDVELSPSKGPNSSQPPSRAFLPEVS